MKKVYSKVCKALVLGGLVSSTILTSNFNVYAAEIEKFKLSEESITYKDPSKFELDEKDIILKDEVKKEEKKQTVKKTPKKQEIKKENTKVEEKPKAKVVEKPKAEVKEKTKTQNSIKKVYLSQSTQWDNMYYSGDVSEGEKMGELLKIVESNLKQKNIQVFKNDTSMDFKQSLRYGNSLEDIDAYVALHSNAANHESRGPLTIRSDKQKDVGLAESIYDQLISIYPEKNLGRGVMVNNKYAETNGTKAPSTIVEVAFHDNIKDEKWIKENLEEIGKVISNGIEKYLSK